MASAPKARLFHRSARHGHVRIKDVALGHPFSVHLLRGQHPLADITLVSKLGIRGDRDRICIGTAVQRAAETQEACHSLEIGTTSRAYSLITDESAGQFTFDKQRDIYVATGLTVEKMERLTKAAAYRSGSPVFVSSSSAGVAVRASKVANEREVFPARSYCA
jgi:hypothetical protein